MEPALAPAAAATPDRNPPARLFLRTTAVDAPGVATSGTVIAAKPQTFSGTGGIIVNGVSRPAGQFPHGWHQSANGIALPLDSEATTGLRFLLFALAADIYPEWQRE